MNLESLHQQLDSIGTMTEALRWAASQVPPARFLTAIGQDEFTFDVVVRVDSLTYVVFDTT